MSRVFRVRPMFSASAVQARRRQGSNRCAPGNERFVGKLKILTASDVSQGSVSPVSSAIERKKKTTRGEAQDKRKRRDAAILSSLRPPSSPTLEWYAVPHLARSVHSADCRLLGCAVTDDAMKKAEVFNFLKIWTLFRISGLKQVELQFKIP